MRWPWRLYTVGLIFAIKSLALPARCPVSSFAHNWPHFFWLIYTNIAQTNSTCQMHPIHHIILYIIDNVAIIGKNIFPSFFGQFKGSGSSWFYNLALFFLIVRPIVTHFQPIICWPNLRPMPSPATVTSRNHHGWPPFDRYNFDP